MAHFSRVHLSSGGHADCFVISISFPLSGDITVPRMAYITISASLERAVDYLLNATRRAGLECELSEYT